MSQDSDDGSATAPPLEREGLGDHGGAVLSALPERSLGAHRARARGLAVYGVFENVASPAGEVSGMASDRLTGAIESMTRAVAAGQSTSIEAPDEKLRARIADHLAEVQRRSPKERHGWHGGEQRLMWDLADDLREIVSMFTELRRLLGAVRHCEHANCRLCPTCVTRLYVVAKPAPETIATQYASAPWRKP